MGTIFISYRRDDTSAWAGRLSDTLKATLGRVSIFRDIEDIPPGVEFDSYIAQAVGSCDALLALIGPNWLSASDSAGTRRLDDPKDLTRLEIATALKRDIRVIPVLVAGAKMPGPPDLPDELKPLSQRQAYDLTDTHWSADCRRLAELLEPFLHVRSTRQKVVIGVAAAAVIAGSVGGLGAFVHWRGAPQSAATTAELHLPATDARGTNARLDGTWPNGAVIRVGFLNGSPAQRQKVEQVAPEWSRHANLRFHFVDQATGDVRVLFASNIASWSFRGSASLDVPARCPSMTLVGIGDSVTISVYERAAILHEFGHVLGFLDEIQNPNGHIPWRPEVIAAPANYAYVERTGECPAPLNRPVTYQDPLPDYRAFDPRSIMMAAIGPAYLTENVSLGGSLDLSDSDKVFAARLYPR